jgi:hypothetical protein
MADSEEHTSLLHRSINYRRKKVLLYWSKLLFKFFNQLVKLLWPLRLSDEKDLEREEKGEKRERKSERGERRERRKKE